LQGVILGSLFSGVGGLDLACEQFFGATTIWQVEKDPACVSVLERHWPDAKRYDDIMTLDFEGVEPVDILCGGFPCQPFSVAGKQKGFDDDRDLWPHFARAIRVLRPRVVVGENVSGFVRLGLERTICDLARLGYVGSWRVVRASDVGACHRRARLFVVAYPSGDGFLRSAERDERHANGNGRGRSLDVEARRLLPTPTVQDGENVAGASQAERNSPPLNALAWKQPDQWGRYTEAIARHEVALGRPAPAPCDEKRRLSPEFVEWMMMLPDGWTHGSRTQRLKMLGNAVVPPQALYALGTLANRLH
jgi:DNA (cytosine-5)-methyltransferase 1